MTSKLQKAYERTFVEETAKHIGATWRIQDGERPDFIVSDGSTKFGLEVTQIFTGEQDHSGSAMKTNESIRHKRIDGIRRAYQAVHDVPLWVRFRGRLNEETLAHVKDALLAVDFPSKPLLHTVVLDEGMGLSVRATKAHRPIWIYEDDGRGWLDHAPEEKIVERITIKAKLIPQYKSTAGSDVRLLIVANRFENSGKLTLRSSTAFDLQGFQKVYFYSRPMSVTDLEPL
jgi:hypothetical protein